MKKSDELKQERQAKIDAQQNLVNLRTAAADGNFTTEQRGQFDTLQTEVDDYDALIEREMKIEALQLRNAAATAIIPSAPEGADTEVREFDQLVGKFDFHKALRSQMSGQRGLDGPELEVHQELQKRAAASGVTIEGVAIPTPQKRAAQQTVTQDAGAYGANLVNEDLQSPIDFLRPNPVLRQLGATYLTGLQGNIAFPVNKGGIQGSWEGEITTVAASKNEYDKKSMSPHRYAATVGLSLQNILQSNTDLQGYTVQEINRVVANAIDAAGINGSGTGNVPEGILNATGVATIAAGTNGADPLWAHIVGMETEVMNANYIGSRYGYLVNSRTKGKLKTTKHEAGDATYLMSAANEINGYGVGVSNLVPNDLTKGTGTALSAGIFGDFSQLIIGQWGFMDMVVDNITGAKSGIVEITVNSFLDMILRHPEAFAVVKDWQTS